MMHCDILRDYWRKTALEKNRTRKRKFDLCVISRSFQQLQLSFCYYYYYYY